jgi:hypothetical protein
VLPDFAANQELNPSSLALISTAGTYFKRPTPAALTCFRAADLNSIAVYAVNANAYTSVNTSRPAANARADFEIRFLFFGTLLTELAAHGASHPYTGTARNWR